MIEVMLRNEASFCKAYFGPLGEILLQIIYTDPKYRGKGYATRLIKELINLGHKRGGKVIVLDDMTNAPAEKNIYCKLGFQIQSLTKFGRKIWVNWKKDSIIIGPERRLLL